MRVVPTRTSAALTWPSLPGNVCMILPIGHLARGVLGDNTSTMSSTWRSRFAVRHFVRACSPGNHSHIQRPRNAVLKLINLWIPDHTECFHLCRRHTVPKLVSDGYTKRVFILCLISCSQARSFRESGSNVR